MSTAALTIFRDEHGQEIVVMYTHYDGYLQAHGKKLVEFLQDMKLTNGIPLASPDKKIANGMSCLAAQVIAKFKDRVGDVYLWPAGKRDMGEDYIYEVSGKVDEEVHVIGVKLHGKDKGILFSGKASEVLNQINKI